MESTPSSQERNDFFQKLKPICVKISQLAIRDVDNPASIRELGELSNQILAVLNDQIQRNPVVLDDKLAEYVFFPLYHIFRQMDRYPMLLVENCVKALTLLITHGWKSKLSSELVQQILNLFIFIIDGVPGSKEKRDVPEETVVEAFRGLTALITTAGLSPSAASGLLEAGTIPALGHGVTVILNGIVDGPSPQIQQEALRSLQAVYRTIKEHAALASFLPGTMSSLSKVCSSPNRYKKVVITKCLDAMTLVLTRVLADLRTRSILAKVEAEQPEEHDQQNKILSPSWLKATTIQVKRALSTVLKLRTNHATEIRSALRRLCVTLLDECHKTLENCSSILVETAMVLGPADERTSFTETSLEDLANIYPELGNIIKSTTYNWLTSLPRLMQANDEDVKQTAIHNVLKGLELLKRLHIGSSTLEDSISNALRDSIILMVQTSTPLSATEDVDIEMIDADGSTTAEQASQYRPVLLPYESQNKTRSELVSLVAFLGSSPLQTRLANTMLEQVQESASSFGQIASFWLCFQLIKASHNAAQEEEMFLDLSSFSDSSEDMETVNNDLYAMSVQILDRYADTEPGDWRLEALALEFTAYTAQRSGESFRPELIDVLFPIATFLGSSNQNLQKHAIVTLNSIADSCRYNSVSELIIDNVDYMVNSVSLRLNTLDISPASINVLTMMIRLAGPRLVPYLDDVIESIFSALDNYHGYPLFVENLFTVLREVVDQGVRSDVLLLEKQKTARVSHRKQPPRADGIARLLETLAKRKQRAGMEENFNIGSHPEEPWKTEAMDEGADEASGPPPEEEKPPNSPTYQLLARIASLTQHYLTSPTPTLRRSLLELLTTASAGLAADEDAFLPLVNAIWPVVVERLHDPEAYVAVEACHALASLCAAAGDFLSSRFKTEWGDWLREWCRKAKRQATITTGWARPHGDEGKTWGSGGEGNRILIPGRGDDRLAKGTSYQSDSPASGGLGKFASPARVWEATVELLTAIVAHVRVDEDMFDEILDLLSDALEQNVEVREALEAVNGDAVWLLRYERGKIEPLPTPQLAGVQFVAM